jgi:hypothetical protein
MVFMSPRCGFVSYIDNYSFGDVPAKSILWFKFLSRGDKSLMTGPPPFFLVLALSSFY